uniref:Glyceraldehyde 3-phosphate dehydrogenase NAD(P) binding domain-containing protein n=2 Tax=Trichobilharzia regenti TaxID=157069 RepID=A0AA85K2Q6_TRIRE|nr:unnamed protein product [Trichobilharzia regenti]
MYSAWKQVIGDPLMPKEWPKRVRIGINGFNEIARLIIRCSLEDKRGLDVVAINVTDMTTEQIIYMIQYDTLLGQFKGCLSKCVSFHLAKENSNESVDYCTIEIAGRILCIFQYEDISCIPWDCVNVEYVIETTGKFTQLDEVSKHLTRGRASKVLVIGDNLNLPLLMYPISCRGYQRGTSIVSSGSAASHAVATLVALIDAAIPIEECMATIMLPVDDKMNLVDNNVPYGNDWRKGRSAYLSIIPGRCHSTIQSVIQALPNMKNRIDGITLNIPIMEGGLVDLACRLNGSIENIEELVEKIKNSHLLKSFTSLHKSCQPFKREIKVGLNEETIHEYYNLNENDLTTIAKFLPEEDAFVSSDASKKSTLCLFDIDCCSKLQDDNTVRVVSWFDLNMSFSQRILDTIVFMRNVDHS